MLYAIIADIHGNYPALQAVLEDAQKAGAEQYFFLGDYFTDFPFTREILETLTGLKHAIFVSGNREWYMAGLNPRRRHLEQYAALFLTREALGEKGLSWISNLPKSFRLFTPDGASSLFLEHVHPIYTDEHVPKKPCVRRIRRAISRPRCHTSGSSPICKGKFRKNPESFGGFKQGKRAGIPSWSQPSSICGRDRRDTVFKPRFLWAAPRSAKGSALHLAAV